MTHIDQGAASKLRSTRKQIRFAGGRSILALILREMATTYGRTPGGYLWVVLEPVLGITFLAAIFSLGFRNPPLGTNFALFYATGFLPFTLYTGMMAKIATSVNYSRNLLSYPRVTYGDAIIARFILTLLTQLVVSIIVLSVILHLWDTRTVFHLERVMLAYAMTAALATGVGIMNCFLFTMFPLFHTMWAIAMRPLVILSGVILLYDSLPRIARDILWYNPLIHIMGEMRAGFYLGYEAKYVSPLYVFGVALVLAVIGLVFLGRYHRDMLER